MARVSAKDKKDLRAEREERLSKALRQNLQRRKSQGRARREEQAEPASKADQVCREGEEQDGPASS